MPKDKPAFGTALNPFRILPFPPVPNGTCPNRYPSERRRRAGRRAFGQVGFYFTHYKQALKFLKLSTEFGDNKK
ncbi:MAG: hypothetical protein A3D13_06480 [Planctomycetes bacterium RIFCSPHIGHO2_02_FULL_40_12]|nr:MAG: hypothetical protein A3D13_06480 [Planctomycetes bacterium RIFCSPHIGHO2_02_FULL_40_12]